MYYVYILLCKDGSLYTGITTDVHRRLKEHKEGKGGHYTRSHTPLRMVYKEKHKNRSSATKRELAIKKLKKEDKLKLINI